MKISSEVSSIHVVHRWKLFTVTPPVNLQNDRVYVAVPMRKKQVSANRLLHTCFSFSKSVMVSVGVSSLGCKELIFIDPGLKINGAYYRDVLLGEYLLPAIKELLGSEFFIFQLDMLQLTESEKLWTCFQEKLQILFQPLFGLPIALISTRSTTRYGASFKNVFIKPAHATLTNSNSDLWRNGKCWSCNQWIARSPKSMYSS